MFWLALLLCVACSAQPADLRASSSDNNDDSVIEALDYLTKGIWDDSLDDDSEKRTLGNKRSATHYSPCKITGRDWDSAKYLKKTNKDILPSQITVEECLGATNDVKKQGCMNLMDCVTQYQQQQFQQKAKGAPCTDWQQFDAKIPVGCKCMMQA